MNKCCNSTGGCKNCRRTNFSVTIQPRTEYSEVNEISQKDKRSFYKKTLNH